MKRLLIIIPALLAALCVSGQTLKTYNLITRNTGSDTMWDGQVIRVFGFTQKLSENTQLPSTTLYANEGDTLVLHVRNISQGAPHTLHPHGMDADQANDGTPMTSFNIGHLEEATYRIYCSHAGTYIYHCHVGDVAHVQAGMYGLIVVRPKDGGKKAWTNGPSYDQEYAWLMSEVDKSWHDTLPENPNYNDSSAHEDFMIPPYQPEYFLVHGLSKQQIKGRLNISAKKGEKIYLRLANIGFYMNEIIFPSALGATWIDSDGRPLPKAIRGDTLRLAPGERYGVMLFPKTDFADQIYVHFVNMNTRKLWSIQMVPISISGQFVSGIDEQENEDILIYPNPASETLTIESELLKGTEPITISLINMLGQEVMTQTFHGTGVKYTLQLPALPNGVYVAQIVKGTSLCTKRIVISNNK